jgi:hypothetical protein
MRWLSLGIGVVGAIGLAGCGLGVQSPDLFLLTRTGLGGKLTLLVNDGGTIGCNGRPPRTLPDPLLLRARDLATSLDGDAKEKLRIASAPGSVYRYTIRLPDGTISFPDTAAAGGRYPRLAQAELFTVQAAQQACGLSG